MPIEFYCPGCGNLMRTPDETAGRKGRCPTCQLKVQIPANSVASSSSDATGRRPAPKASTPAAVRFNCSHCGKTLSVAAANAGKQGQCPHCGQRMSIPKKSPSPEARWKGVPPSSPAQASTPATASTRAAAAPDNAASAKIEFACSSCREIVRIGAAAAGKKGRCPRCNTVIQIPHRSAPAAGLPSVPRQKPKQNSQPRGNPNAATSGLTPLPSTPAATKPRPVPGLTPLPSTTDPSGLTPLDDKALSPLEPLGLTPLAAVDSAATGNDLFGPGPIGSGSSFAVDPNPFSAPRPIHPIPAKASQRPRTGAEIATMICGGCLIFYAVGQIVVVTLSMFVQGAGMLSMVNRLREQGDDPAFATGFVVGQVIAVGLSGLVMLTILAGGIQMIRFKAWGLCLAACILTMIPCNCLCLLGLPFGIWGTVMLSQGSVRSAFY